MVPDSRARPDPADPERVQRHLPVRHVEFQILLSLGRGPRHGYGVIQDAEERTGGAFRLDVATLYRALKRMERDGLVAEAEERPTGDDDARRRYYDLTPLGRAVAEAEARRLTALVRAARGADLLDGVGPA